MPTAASGERRWMLSFSATTSCTVMTNRRQRPTIPGRRSLHLTDADLQKVFRSKFAPLQRGIAPGVAVFIDRNCASYFDDAIASASIVPLQEVVPSLIEHWRRSGLQALV